MGDDSSIQWVGTPMPDGRIYPGATFNAWIGCEEVSPECDLCYARTGSKRLAAQHHLTLWPGEPGGPSDRFFTGESYWKQPAKWNREAERDGVRKKVFCASFADVFEDRPDLVERRARLFRVIADTPHLDWLLLTKRPQNIRRLAAETQRDDVLHQNVWLGTTVGLQSSMSRAVELVRAPDAVQKFLSIEPLLDREMNLDPPVCPDCGGLEVVEGTDEATPFCPECETEMCYGGILDPLNGGVTWGILGGESGGNKTKLARPLHLAAARSVMAQLKDAGVATFFKQMGRRIIGDPAGFEVNHWLLGEGAEWSVEWVPPIIGDHKPPANLVGFTLFDGHGGDPAAWAPEFRVRQYPEAVVR